MATLQCAGKLLSPNNTQVQCVLSHGFWQLSGGQQQGKQEEGLWERSGSEEEVEEFCKLWPEWGAGVGGGGGVVIGEEASASHPMYVQRK